MFVIFSIAIAAAEAAWGCAHHRDLPALQNRQRGQMDS